MAMAAHRIYTQSVIDSDRIGWRWRCICGAEGDSVAKRPGWAITDGRNQHTDVKKEDQ